MPPHTRLTLGPRPKVKRAAQIGRDAYVACCLLPQEAPKDLLTAYGNHAVHLPFTVYGLKTPNRSLLPRVGRLADLLGADTPVHVHCAAGMHRTGVIGYTLLRLNGYTPTSALDAIEEIRPITHHALTVYYPALRGYAEREFITPLTRP